LTGLFGPPFGNWRLGGFCKGGIQALNPARYPHGLPQFFIKFLTEPGDLVLDPFVGSNVTGEVCEKVNRQWITIELIEEYLKGSKFRFDKFGFGEWVERSGQKAFLLSEGKVKYTPSQTNKRKKEH